MTRAKGKAIQKAKAQKPCAITAHLNEISSFESGAKSAFGLGLLAEFGSGGTGVVEIHFHEQMPTRVSVRAVNKSDDLRNVRGVVADWSMTPQQLGSLLASTVLAK